MPRNDTQDEELLYYRLRKKFAEDEEGLVSKAEFNRLLDRVALLQLIVFGAVSILLTGMLALIVFAATHFK